MTGVHQGDEEGNGSQRVDALEWICHCTLSEGPLVLYVLCFFFCPFASLFYYLRDIYYADCRKLTAVTQIKRSKSVEKESQKMRKGLIVRRMPQRWVAPTAHAHPKIALWHSGSHHRRIIAGTTHDAQHAHICTMQRSREQIFAQYIQHSDQSPE